MVIKHAVYGDLDGGKSVDVTKKVADAVRDGALSIRADNSVFGDPAYGRTKKLKVDYSYGGVDKFKTIVENQTLTISKTGE